MSDAPQVHKVPGGLEFIINDDGSVTFIKLPPEMLDVARSLDPDAVIACDVKTGDDSDESAPR